MNSFGWHRIPEGLRAGIVIATFAAWILANMPPYTKIYYTRTEAVDCEKYHDEYTGYPAGNGFDELTTLDEIKEYKGNYILKVDVSKLTPVKVYGDLEKRNVDKDKFYSGLTRIGCENMNYGVGRFFAAELSSGDRVCVFLDDHSLMFPRSGEMVLPIAKTEATGNGRVKELLREKTDLTAEETEVFVDAAGEWRMGKEGQKAYHMVMFLLIASFVVVFILVRKVIKVMMVAEESARAERGPLK